MKCGIVYIERKIESKTESTHGPRRCTKDGVKENLLLGRIQNFFTSGKHSPEELGIYREIGGGKEFMDTLIEWKRGKLGKGTDTGERRAGKGKVVLVFDGNRIPANQAGALVTGKILLVSKPCLNAKRVARTAEGSKGAGRLGKGVQEVGWRKGSGGPGVQTGFQLG